jgi:hypothetical protein
MIRPLGDPSRVRTGAKWFQAAAARVEQLGLELRRHSAASSDVWLGWASFRFQHALGWAENDCAEAVTAFLAAGAALHRYADALEAAQQEYDAAMAGAEAAGYGLRGDVLADASADPAAGTGGQAIGFPSPARATERLQQAHQAAKAASDEAAGHLDAIAQRAHTVPHGRHGRLTLDPFNGIAERGAVAAGLLRGSLRAGPALVGRGAWQGKAGVVGRLRSGLDGALPGGLASGGPVAAGALEFAAGVYAGEAPPKAAAEAAAGAVTSGLMLQQGSLGCLALAETGPAALGCEVGVVTVSALASLRVRSWVSDLWDTRVDPRGGADRKALADELQLIEKAARSSR